MSEEEFEKNRTALLETIMEKEKNIAETSYNLWRRITSRRYDFDAKPQEVRIVRQLSKQDIMVNQLLPIHLSYGCVRSGIMHIFHLHRHRTPRFAGALDVTD